MRGAEQSALGSLHGPPCGPCSWALTAERGCGHLAFGSGLQRVCSSAADLLWASWRMCCSQHLTETSGAPCSPSPALLTGPLLLSAPEVSSCCSSGWFKSAGGQVWACIQWWRMQRRGDQCRAGGQSSLALQQGEGRDITSHKEGSQGSPHVCLCTGDDMSGSGSGDSCPDDVCGKRLSKTPSTRQPETHAIPKQSGHGINGASSRSLPSAFFLLLSVAFIATQHLWR